MRRPKKNAGTRVMDRLHIGYRFTRAQSAMMETCIQEARQRAMERGLAGRTVTLSSLVRAWVDERVRREYQRLSGGSILAEDVAGNIVAVELNRPGDGAHGLTLHEDRS